MENSFAITTTFIVYLILMLAIGVYAYQRTKNSADYFLGGRSLGPWPAALSAGASDMSGWLLLGLPGYAYAAGIESFWLAGGLLVGTWANWLVNAKRLRTYSITTDSLTLPEFLSRRFNDNSNSSRPFLRSLFCCSSSSIPVRVWWQAVNCLKPYSAWITPPR